MYVAAQKRRPSRSEARAALRAEIDLIERYMIQIWTLRDAVNESVPTQIERCESITAGNGPETDWTKLEPDAFWNGNNIHSLAEPLINGIRAQREALPRYVPAFSDEEGKSLERAIGLLGSAEGSYALGFVTNIDATYYIRRHNCALAVESRSKSGPHFKDGDDAWDKAMAILKGLAPPDPDQPALVTGSLTVISSSPNPAGSGQPVSFLATVTSVTSLGTPTGTVTFEEGSKTLDTETLDAEGHATFVTTTLSLGMHSITAAYGGDEDFLPSTSPALTQAVSAISLSPTSITFAAQRVGTTSKPQSLTMTNHGNKTVTISSMKITGMPQPDFAVASTTCGSTLAAGASCTIKLTFTPKSKGNQTANRSVSDDAVGSPLQASLRGTAN